MVDLLCTGNVFFYIVLANPLNFSLSLFFLQFQFADIIIKDLRYDKFYYNKKQDQGKDKKYCKCLFYLPNNNTRVASMLLFCNLMNS